MKCTIHIAVPEHWIVGNRIIHFWKVEKKDTKNKTQKTPQMEWFNTYIIGMLSFHNSAFL